MAADPRRLARGNGTDRNSTPHKVDGNLRDEVARFRWTLAGSKTKEQRRSGHHPIQDPNGRTLPRRAGPKNPMCLNSPDHLLKDVQIQFFLARKGRVSTMSQLSPRLEDHNFGENSIQGVFRREDRQGVC
ncbi:conserved hypothetical protein [Coccidioides posadasii str. Silveira]|uniref:Uncharacterized protein n=1 Tax=Coccidioides posadasii (strain RMSCC 757 / Silveira) TaxID=443226 RepID=E9CYS2_COCPS|nr:conserved hypothetical protein [Coccidioides posadasii str. Silveira]